MKDKGHGIVLDENGQEQPKDKQLPERQIRPPGHMPHEPVKEVDQPQPLREKSGF